MVRGQGGSLLCKPECGANTSLENAGHLTRIFEHLDDGKYEPFLLTHLRAPDVDRYISRRRSEAVSDHTIAKELVTLRASLKLAKRAGLWLGDIDALLPAGFAPEYQPRTRALSTEELGQLLALLPPARAAQVGFIVATSACWSEAVKARRGDVQLESSWVHIRGAKRAARDRHILVRHPALASLLVYTLEHAPGEDLLFPSEQRPPRSPHRLRAGRHRALLSERPAPHLRQLDVTRTSSG
jgi:integrase